MRRAKLSTRNTLWLTIGGLTSLIVALVAVETWQAWRRLGVLHALRAAAHVSDDLFVAAQELGTERGLGLSLLDAPDSATQGELRIRLARARASGQASLERALGSLRATRGAERAEALDRIEARLARIAGLRAELDGAVRGGDPTLGARWLEESDALVGALGEVWLDWNQELVDLDPEQRLHQRFKQTLWMITQLIGRERALVGRLLAEDAAPSADDQVHLLEWRGGVNFGWQALETLIEQSQLGAGVGSRLGDAESHYATVYDIVGDTFYVTQRRARAPHLLGLPLWLELSAQENESLLALREAAREEMRRYDANRESDARREILLRALVLAVATGLCLSALRVIAARVLGPIREMVDALVWASQAARSVEEVGEERDEVAQLARVLDGFSRSAVETRRNAEALERYAHALERSNRELDDFAYIASHDLKEPLRGIHNHARFLLEDNEEKLDPESAKRLHRLTYLSQRMEKLVNDLLYFSRLGRQDLAVGPTDLNAVVHDVVDTLDSFLAERKAAIHVHPPLPTAVCDRVRVTELFRNLITNAVKYNDRPEKSVWIEFAPTRTRADGSTARGVFAVRDDGIGIAPEFHEEVFRIFKRLHGGRGEEQEGTGVGLTFVKKIVERHGGAIWIESEPGAGTAVCFTLGGA